MSTTNQQKFENMNPVQQRLIGRFQEKLLEAVKPLQPESVLELGCGEGFLLSRIKKEFPHVPMLGLDNNPEAVAEGKRLFPDVQLETGDIYAINQPDNSWDVTMASEVLEHLEHPEQALKELARVAKRYVVLSVPHEPWFRLGNLARGRHVKRLGNHPEHINLWSRRRFARFVAHHLNVVRVSGALPWTIVVAKP